MDGNHMVNMAHTVNQLVKPSPTKVTMPMQAAVNFRNTKSSVKINSDFLSSLLDN